MEAKLDERIIELPETHFSKREDRDLPAVVESGNAGSLIQAISRAAADPRTDMDKMERLFVMHQKIMAQQAETAFNAAMAKAQAKIETVVRNRKNTHISSTYADLAAINKVITPLYTEEGLSVSFDSARQIIGPDGTPVPPPTEGLRRTVAIVSHAAGHSRLHYIDLPPDDAGAQGKVNKTQVQAAGSTNSYARRYLVCMIFNVTTEDDADGNDTKRKGMPIEQYNEFAKRIEEQTTKEKAKAVYTEAIKVCVTFQDVGAAELLKAILVQHGEFIDNANKASAK
jgi:hypothetical protein